jgi:hypothetical protein
MSERPTITALNRPLGRPWALTRPVTTYLAERLKVVGPQLDALNEARKTQLDAAAALGMEVNTVRNYADILGLTWLNIARRPRNPGKSSR